MKRSLKRKCLDLSSNPLNTFFMEMYRDQFGEFVFGYWRTTMYTVTITVFNLFLLSF